MVDFAGYALPVSYTGILAEHEAVRTHVGIFDVSHMGEVDIAGPQAAAAVQQLVTNDVSRLQPGRALYTMMCREDGGIVDDCIVYQRGPTCFRIVLNAATTAKDLAHIRAHVHGADVRDCSDDFALIAVQGPGAVTMVNQLCGDAQLHDVPSFGFIDTTLAGAEVMAARTGYTGEDGFELFVAPAHAAEVWHALVHAGATPCGLGARDTLRLEARLCLYGQDIDDTTHPLEAGLKWTVRFGCTPAFVGEPALAVLAAQPLARTLVGFVVDERGIVRAGADILEPSSGDMVGRVTSGGVAPTVGGSIGLGYVPPALSESGQALVLRQRGRDLKAHVVRGPFYRRTSTTP